MPTAIYSKLLSFDSLFSRLVCVWVSLTKLSRALKPYSEFIYIKLVAHPNCTKFDTARPWVHSNIPTNCEADQMNGSLDIQRIYRQTDRDSTPQDGF